MLSRNQLAQHMAVEGRKRLLQTGRFKASAQQITTDTTLTITKPAGTRQGDLLVALIAPLNSAAPNSVPSGWTLYESSGAAALFNLYYKFAVAGEGASYQWGWAASALHHGAIVTYDGIHADAFVTSIVLSSTSSPFTSSLTNPAIVPVRAVIAAATSVDTGSFGVSGGGYGFTTRQGTVAMAIGDQLSGVWKQFGQVTFEFGSSMRGVIGALKLAKATVLLCHFDGADASTAMTDSSEIAGHGTALGNAQIATAQSVFGGAALLLDGTGDIVTFPDSYRIHFDALNFEIRMRARLNTVAAGVRTLIGKRASASGFGPFLIEQSAATLRASLSSDGASHDIANGVQFASGLVTGQWYDLAFWRNGSNFYASVDGAAGTLIASSAAALVDNTQLLRIGADSASQGFNGWIDELRIQRESPSIGAASSYQVAPAAFADDE